MLINKLKIVLISFIIFFFSFCKKVQTAKINATQGKVNLEKYDFKNKSVYLDGEWEFYPGELIDSTVIHFPKNFLSVPSAWNEKLGTNYGFASYKLTITLAKDFQELLVLRIPEQGTAYTLFVNGKFLAKNGIVSKTAEGSKPEFFPILTHRFIATEKLELVFHISNFEHREGGFWYSILLGTEDNVNNFRENSLLLDVFLFGSILIMGIYHIGLYIIRKKDFAPLFFGLFCLAILARLLSQNEKYIVYIFQGITFSILNRIEYLGYYLALPSFAGFLYSTFPKEFNRIILYFLFIFTIISSLIVLFTKSNFYTQIVLIFHFFTMISFLYFCFVFFKAFLNKRSNVKMLFVGMLFLVIGTINDILHSIELIHTSYITPQTLLAFIFIQSIVLSIRFSKAFYDNEVLISEMIQLNEVSRKFLPTGFIESIGKKNFSEVKLGDQILKEMTVLFSDIRNFTSLSEKMSPAENFRFINDYLSVMGPLVRKHNGFIDKYIGDAIMALFENPDDAIQSAIEMQKALLDLNENSKTEIKIGIGIHTGTLMMGVIGEKERLEGTVISDAVNLASRIEGLNKLYKTKILISEDSLLKLRNVQNLNYMKIDRVKVKGKEQEFTIYEVLDALSEEELESLSHTKLAFEIAVDSFQNKQYSQALELFERAFAIYPNHYATELYLNRCKEKLK